MADDYTPVDHDPFQGTPVDHDPFNPSPARATFDQAQKDYPILGKLDLQFKENPRTDGRMLEFWAPGEPGDKEEPRPKELHIDKPGVEINSDKTTPLDVLGDVVSHHLINTDDTVKGHYEAFKNSMTDDQKSILQDQYKHAQDNYGEKRDFDTWNKASGTPAYFRGYAFKQWDKAFTDKNYTPEQKQGLDKMMDYLKK